MPHHTPNKPTNHPTTARALSGSTRSRNNKQTTPLQYNTHPSHPEPFIPNQTPRASFLPPCPFFFSLFLFFSHPSPRSPTATPTSIRPTLTRTQSTQTALHILSLLSHAQFSSPSFLFFSFFFSFAHSLAVASPLLLGKARCASFLFLLLFILLLFSFSDPLLRLVARVLARGRSFPSLLYPFFLPTFFVQLCSAGLAGSSSRLCWVAPPHPPPRSSSKSNSPPAPLRPTAAVAVRPLARGLPLFLFFLLDTVAGVSRSFGGSGNSGRQTTPASFCFSFV